jgi:hypothetical protein
VRRLLVLAVALGLVYGVAHLLGSATAGSPGGAASPVGASVPESSPPSPTPTSYDGRPEAVTSPRAGTMSGKAKRLATASAAPSDLATPTGPCADSDVTVDPSVDRAYAGRTVVFTLSMTSRVSPACTFVVSPRSLVVRVTSGSDRIWSTQECVGAVPKQSVVVRRDVPATVSVAWNGQRSDSDCTRATPWAQPGYYHVTAAVYGAVPTDQQFELGTPPRPTVLKTPKPSKGAHAKHRSTAKPSATPTKH